MGNTKRDRSQWFGAPVRSLDKGLVLCNVRLEEVMWLISRMQRLETAGIV